MGEKLHLHILASGSKGNAVIVEGPEGSLLVDCGLSRRELVARAEVLGLDVGRVAAVLITHEHSDHVSGLSVWSRQFKVPIYATAGTAHARSYLSQLPICELAHDATLELAGMRVSCFPTSHDVADPMCFRFETVDGGDSIGLCTDTGVLTDEARVLLRNCRILALEANHDATMLAEGPYPSFLKERIASSHGHLSNAQAAQELPELVGPATQYVVAMHISEKNNLPSHAVKTLAQAVGAELDEGHLAQAHTKTGLGVFAATQHQPLSFV